MANIQEKKTKNGKTHYREQVRLKGYPFLKKVNIFLIILTIFVLTFISNGNCYSLELENENSEVWYNTIFDELSDRMYCISETTGNIYEFNSAIDEYCDIILKHIEEGYDPNEKDYYGWTALIYASVSGFPKLVEELLKIPLIRNNIDLRDNLGFSALDYAMHAPELSSLFLNPSLRYDMFLVPFTKLQVYYRYASFFQKKPYSKCVDLLRKYGAKENASPLKVRMKNYINNLIASLFLEFNNQHGENDKKMIVAILEEARSNLEKLEQYKEGDDFGEFCIKNTKFD
ncbi:MAG: hypothetical protein K940chlam5_00179 [Candidatus Anoxychlamydiales bacterium]|nr:hypothetical protein [Candidatus Anoxychlamydiales bacterium]